MASSRVLLHAVALAAALSLMACGGSHRDDLPFAFSSALSGGEVVPPTSSAASGAGLVTVDADQRTLNASVITSGMTDT
ncbi:CHRD domain-containing protein, partial [Noviherbaspirillum denitrificans]|uniref:CHRD domain-containing protein n=1 Tax=Noviherbaspirillum denitrificans TaxID=1968433 RepID=UPI00197F05C1